MHTRFQSRMHRQEAHMSAPHLPRYQNTISPDKLECVRACWFFDIAGICHISVRASRWFRIKTKKPKMNPHVILLSLSLSLCLSLSVLSPVFLRWVLSSEAGIWSTSQHHMLHNSQSPILIAEAFYEKFSNSVHGLIVNEAGSYGLKLKI